MSHARKHRAGFHAMAALVALLIGSAVLHDARADSDPVLDANPFDVEARLAQPAADSGVRRRYLEGLAAAGRLADDEARKKLAAVGSDRAAGAEIARRAFERAGAVALRAGRYRSAGSALSRALADFGDGMPADERVGTAQARDVAHALRDEPAQRTEHFAAGAVPLKTDALGLINADARIEGHVQAAVLDTGANLSTLSDTAARTLGLRILDGDASVGSAASDAVHSRVAIADRVQLGPVTLRHVAFLVLDDAALSPAGPGHRIDAILGFPVLSALQRVTFHEDGAAAKTLAISASQRLRVPGNLRFDDFDALVLANAGGDAITLLVDSGATKTALGKRYAAEFPARLAGLAQKTARIGGAGGIETRETRVVPQLDVTIDGKTVPLKDVDIELDGTQKDDAYGTLGTDVLWARGYTIDFRALRLSLGG
jgi:predicted aspartyl protease